MQAIDLVDEACSNVRVQLDSKPENIDSLERQRVRLQVEEQALKKEKDPLSKARLGEVQKELASLEDKLAPLLMQYRQEKERLDNIRRLQVRACVLKLRGGECEQVVISLQCLESWVCFGVCLAHFSLIVFLNDDANLLLLLLLLAEQAPRAVGSVGDG